MSVPAWVEKFTYNASGPEQRWINLGSSPSEMVIGWVTAETDAQSVVYYGTKSGGPYSLSATGAADSYTYGKYTSGLIHHVTLTGLNLNTPYYYVCGAAGAQSAEAAFNSSRGVGAVYPYTLAAIADLGESGAAATTVSQLVDGLDHIDAIQFNGDIACVDGRVAATAPRFAMRRALTPRTRAHAHAHFTHFRLLSYANGCESKGCSTWDALQRMMEPITKTMPTAVEIGNHEMIDYANGISAISSQYRFAGMPFGTRTDKAGQQGVFYYS